MRSKGEAAFASENGAAVVVANDEGFTVVELLGDEGLVQAGNQVEGDWSQVGGEPLF